MKRPKSVSFWIAFLGFGCFDLYVNAAQRGSPHPHQGKLKPFEPGPPKIKLSSADQSKVDDGELVMRQTVIDGGSSGRATAIQAVHAPPRLVWKQLLDLNSYPSKVDKLTECGKYFEKVRGVDGSKNIKARFLVKAAPGFSFEYYCDHIYSPQKKSLTVSYQVIMSQFCFTSNVVDFLNYKLKHSGPSTMTVTVTSMTWQGTGTCVLTQLVQIGHRYTTVPTLRWRILYPASLWIS